MSVRIDKSMFPAILLIKLSGDVPVNNLFINKPIPEKIINSNP